MLIPRRFAALWLLLAAACTSPSQGPDPAPQTTPPLQHLIVLHTNDVHGQVLPLTATWVKDQDPKPTVGGIERVARYIQKVRAEAAEQGAEVLVVDAGDWFQGTPEGGVEQGRAYLRLLQQVGYDAMCVGNHEFDHGVGVLLDHLRAVPLPAVLSNVREADGSFLAGTSPILTLQRAGLRVGILGLCTTETPSITHPSASTLVWNDPAQTVAAFELEFADQVDWFLPLTHLGIETDQVLAEAHPELPLILGGHSHTLLPAGKNHGPVLICQTGSKGRGIGRVDVWVDPAKRAPVLLQAKVVDLFEGELEGTAVPALSAACRALVQQTEAEMEIVVGQNPVALHRSGGLGQSSALGNWITDAMRLQGRGDCAMQNGGGIRADLDAGPVTVRDLFSVLPFENSLVTLTMTGAEIDAVLRENFEGKDPKHLEVSGLRLTLQKSDGGLRLASIEIDGAPLDPARSYRLVTNSFMAGGGGGFAGLQHVREREAGVSLQRDTMRAWLEALGTVEATGEDRYVWLP
ncbi:MAG: bifunctional UDP-sugar hydrolase/5'-nucleotidase [Planctomycetota bacterium]